MKTSDRLLKKLREANLGLDLPEGTVLVRTNRNRRTGLGAWSWFALGPEGRENLRIGSHWSMRELLEAGEIVTQYLDGAGDTCIDPKPAEKEE
jgi:hypothetical protein